MLPRATAPAGDPTSKLNMVQITDGVNEADVIAIINSLKTDLSSVAGTVTAVGAGNVNAGTQRVTLATDDANAAAMVVDLAAIEVAIEIIDNIVGTIGGAHGTGVAVIGMKAESTVPVAVADGQAVAMWGDLYGRMVQLATDVAQSALSVSDIAPAQMQVLRAIDWAALTAPAQETPQLNVQDYENITVQYIIATIDTSVDLKIWGSIDGGTTWFLMTPTFTVLAADPQSAAISFSGVKVGRIKCEFDAEVGGTNAVVTFKVMCGN